MGRGRGVLSWVKGWMWYCGVGMWVVELRVGGVW